MKEKIIKQIWFERKKKNLTQSDIAKQMGVNTLSISRLEKGANVSSHLIWDIMDYLGIKTIE